MLRYFNLFLRYTEEDKNSLGSDYFNDNKVKFV